MNRPVSSPSSNVRHLRACRPDDRRVGDRFMSAIWAIRVCVQLACHVRDPAMLNLASTASFALAI